MSAFAISAVLVILFGFAGTIFLMSIAAICIVKAASDEDDEFEEDEHAQI